MTPDEPGFGWFAYHPHGDPVPDEDPVVRVVILRYDEHAGPWWDDEGYLSDDFDELHRWIGVSRDTYDDVTAWHDAGGDSSLVDELAERLRAEVHAGIAVRLRR